MQYGLRFNFYDQLKYGLFSVRDVCHNVFNIMEMNTEIIGLYEAGGGECTSLLHKYLFRLPIEPLAYSYSSNEVVYFCINIMSSIFSLDRSTSPTVFPLETGKLIFGQET